MKRSTPLIILLFILIFGCKVNARDSSYEVHFIDTGQSDCILIKGIKRNYLIDTGFAGSYENISAYLNFHCVNKLEKIIITHYHDDHYGGLEKLVQNNLINKVILPRHQPCYRDFIFSYLKDKNIQVEYISENFVIKEDNIDLKVLLPKKEDMFIENNNGAVLYGTIDNVKYAFMSDVEKEREKELVKKKELLNSEIIKVPHHGLDTSSTEVLIKTINPKIAVVTCDGRESPSAEVVKRYETSQIAIFRTDTHGNIVIKANPENKEIEITASKVIK
jgi:beta-lactamase superfamily II metal-dependent hydrolase